MTEEYEYFASDFGFMDGHGYMDDGLWKCTFRTYTEGTHGAMIDTETEYIFAHTYESLMRTVVSMTEWHKEMGAKDSELESMELVTNTIILDREWALSLGIIKDDD